MENIQRIAMHMEFKHINEILSEKDLKDLDIDFCSDSVNFSIVRAQLLGHLQADTATGPRVITDDHDIKCESILKNHSDSSIVLFPEYCISYNLIEKIAKKVIPWPKTYTLWCLPCQGIPKADFFDKLTQYEKEDAVIVINEGVDVLKSPGVFITALIYCFIAVSNKDGQNKLVLLPQFKTYRMADQDNLCETDMIVGSKIYIFGETGENRLITLMCSDVMNPDINWKELKNKCGGLGLSLLHPQLNIKPKHFDFASLRNEIFSQDNKSIYISANWAKGTVIEVPKKSSKKR
jgi:hypothetical protein